MNKEFPMPARSRNRAFIALGLMIMFGQIPQAEAKTSRQKGAFVSLLAVNNNPARVNRIVANFDRQTFRLEQQISRQNGLLSRAINRLAALAPTPAQQTSRFYRSQVVQIIARSNGIQSGFARISNLLARESQFDSDRAAQQRLGLNQLALASRPLYDQVSSLASSTGFDRRVATPFGPSSAL